LVALKQEIKMGSKWDQNARNDAVNVLWWIVLLRPNRLGYNDTPEPLET
jgi:hypothetical protein